MPAVYRHRFAEDVLIEMLSHAPVVILEGARAVGKTSLVKNLVDQGHLAQYETFSDAATLQAAQADIRGWLRRLKQPFVIDEAQLLPELPTAIKHLLDENADHISCMLTGSAALGNQGFGGSDPLARRTHRYGLEPLTEAELNDNNGLWSVTDKLFDADPWVKHPEEDATWQEAILLGGMPEHRLTASPRPGRFLHSHVRLGAESILTEDVLPDERFDRIRALTILDHLLRVPAGEINAEPRQRRVPRTLGAPRGISRPVPPRLRHRAERPPQPPRRKHVDSSPLRPERPQPVGVIRPAAHRPFRRARSTRRRAYA